MDRGLVLWNAIIAQDKDFAEMNYEDLAKKICTNDIFKLTFKETSVTMATSFYLNVSNRTLRTTCMLTFR